MPKLPIFILEIASDPLVFCIASGWSAKRSFEECQNRAHGKKFHLLVVPYWEVALEAENFVRFTSYCAQFSEILSVTYLCPSEQDVTTLKSRNLDAIHAIHNAFIDETIFKPISSFKKRFNAVHNAALSAFKRHQLAYGVKNIAVITHKHLPEDDANIIKGYKNLTYTNLKPDGEVDYISYDKIVEILNQSRCGIILSKTEGANFASAEYHFCGLPVVTTPSKGGRSFFIDPQYSSTVWPRRWSVNRAVKYWVRRQPDPDEIHHRTLERAIPHRERLLDHLSKITGQNMRQAANGNAWLPTFKDKLRNRVLVEIDRYEEI